jgi:hypothetical protein
MNWRKQREMIHRNIRLNSKIETPSRATLQAFERNPVAAGLYGVFRYRYVDAR